MDAAAAGAGTLRPIPPGAAIAPPNPILLLAVVAALLLAAVAVALAVTALRRTAKRVPRQGPGPEAITELRRQVETLSQRLALLEAQQHRPREGTAAGVPVALSAPVREPAAAVEEVGELAPEPEAPVPSTRPTVTREEALDRVLGQRAAVTELPVPPEPTEAEAPAPNPVAEVEAMIARGDMDSLALLFAERADAADFAHRENAAMVLEWLTWVCEKLGGLTTQQGEDLLSKLRLWHRRLDYYLWADPAEALRFPDPPGDPLFGESVVHPLVRRLAERQRDVREYLRAQGIGRIEAEPGGAFLPGVVERSDRPTEPTRDRALHDRVYRVEPGDGGYRAHGRVLMPSLARRYEYRPDG